MEYVLVSPDMTMSLECSVEFLGEACWHQVSDGKYTCVPVNAKPKRMNLEVFDPLEGDISIRCAEIRKGWSREEHLRRSAGYYTGRLRPKNPSDGPVWDFPPVVKFCNSQSCAAEIADARYHGGGYSE